MTTLSYTKPTLSGSCSIPGVADSQKYGYQGCILSNGDIVYYCSEAGGNMTPANTCAEASKKCPSVVEEDRRYASCDTITGKPKEYGNADDSYINVRNTVCGDLDVCECVADENKLLEIGKACNPEGSGYNSACYEQASRDNKNCKEKGGSLFSVNANNYNDGTTHPPSNVWTFNIIMAIFLLAIAAIAWRRRSRL